MQQLIKSTINQIQTKIPRRWLVVALVLMLILGADELTKNVDWQQVNQTVLGTQTETQEYQSNFPPNQTAPNNPEIKLAQVIEIVDGDTIKVDIGGGEIKTVRYIGIDTPEIVAPGQDVECYGREASRKNTELVEGAIVGLETDVNNTDQYGRLLRYVYLGDLLVNQVLVKEGYAFASAYPPDVKYQDDLDQAELEAREANRGLWSACDTDVL